MKGLLFCFCWLLLQECLALRLKRETPDSASRSCILELNLEAEKILKINGEDYTPVDNEDYGRYTECYWKRMNYINEFGEFNVDNLKKMVVESIKMDVHTTKSMHKIADLILEQCRHSNGPTIGTKAIKMENCIIKYYKVFLNKYSEIKTTLIS